MPPEMPNDPSAPKVPDPSLDTERKENREKVNEYLKNNSLLLKQEGIEGIKKVAKDIGKNLRMGGMIKYFSEKGEIPDKPSILLEMIEEIIKEVFYLKSEDAEKLYSETYGEVLDGGVDILLSTVLPGKDGFYSWSHRLCHLFETYPGNSLLDLPGETVKRIIDKVVLFSVEYHEMANAGRVIGSLLDYNLDHLDLGRLDGDFPLKPNSLNNIEFATLFRSDSIMLFCLAKTPREMLTKFIKTGVNFGRLNPEKVIACLDSVKDEVTETEMNAYINKYYRVNDQETTLSTLTGNLFESLEASEVIEGVYVDVEGTLIKNGELNINLIGLLEEENSKGKKVSIFTGGAVDEQTSRLRALGFPEKFFPVVAKEGFKGKILEELIDDTPPQYQGFKALKYSKI